MAKTDVVSAQLAVIQAAQVQAISDGLGACYDQGATDQKGIDGSFNQGDIDTAVAKALADAKVVSDKILADAQAVDAQALSDAQAKAASDLAVIQSSLDEMTKKEQLEEGVVSQLQSSVSAVQSSLDAIKALVLPALVPAPIPAPAPVDGSAPSVPVSS